MKSILSKACFKPRGTLQSQMLVAFTDGSCKLCKTGGWGWIVYAKNGTLKFSDWGGKPHTTNQQMELTAMRKCLEFLPKGRECELWSDSTYVLGGIVGTVQKNKGDQMSNPRLYHPKSGWMSTWDRSTSRANFEEWEQLRKILEEHYHKKSILRFGWVKGHAGIEGNEIADRLANRYFASLRIF